MSFIKQAILSGFLALCLGSAHLGFAQGCCDAGACTLAPFKAGNDVNIEDKKYEITAGGSYGRGIENINVIGANLELAAKISNKFSISSRIGYNHNQGELASIGGLSDLFLTGNYRIKENIRVTVGGKIPLNNGNIKETHQNHNHILPMPYQPSIGSYDIIAGINYRINKLGMSLLSQIPVTRSKNTYFASSDLPFLSTNELQRMPDVILRAAYEVISKEKLSVVPSILGIYHLANDTYQPLSGSERISIVGSSGLTLNIGLRGLYWFRPNQGIELNLGFPVIVREKMPDGLTRSAVIGLDYKYKF